jgi:hypothetical protein
VEKGRGEKGVMELVAMVMAVLVVAKVMEALGVVGEEEGKGEVVGMEEEESMQKQTLTLSRT